MIIEFAADKATWTANANGAFLCIPSVSPAKVLAELEPGKGYVCEIKKQHKRRSLDANAYYWVMCGKIAQHQNLTAVEVYREHIRDISNYEVYGIRLDAVETFDRLWTSGHLGRFTETRAARTPGVVNVLAYYGSSDFDTVQMSHLIDNCLQDCRALGIETKPQEEIDSLLEAWGDAQGN